MGRRLKHVKENDLAHGEFGKWLESVGMNARHARRFLTVYERFGKRTPVSELQIGMSVLYELASFTDEELTQPIHQDNGETKTLLEMSRREVAEYKRKLREAESTAETARKDAEIKIRHYGDQSFRGVLFCF
ncbi:DUF3102 domain-containing protein [Rummeliibacillus suwonensis]|uniref:DUF3102 domain-containing protein n=1 Tax=Rummeliibacillus suwonensis TaxID=1306154 RepID=UPI001AAF813A|nr:DUF3102 domain-containing protein [Rummeliibacillus suwonensis]